MIRTVRSWRFAPLLLVVTVAGFCASAAGAQQPEAQASATGKFLNVKVPLFEVNKQTLLDALWKLAAGPASFGFGYEGVLKLKSSDPDIPDPQLKLQLKGKTVRQILDALCRADSRYTWSLDKATSTVNVFPKDVVNDPSYLLNRRLQRFELKNATNIDNALFAIPRQLPSPFEQVAVMQFNGDDRWPPTPWTATYHDLTVRQVVNRLKAHAGPCGVWTFGGAKDFRRFALFNTNFCTEKATPPWIQKIINAPCGGCVPGPLPCDGLMECCQRQ
jgi:hypothetical protein